MSYGIIVFSMLLLCGALSLSFYGSGQAERAALGIIAAFVIISPVAREIGNIDISSALDKLPSGDYVTDADPSVIAEEAFADGIKKAVTEKFSVDGEDIRVKIIKFNMKEMSAEKIIIYLSGSAIFKDYRGIEEYVSSLGMGECRVEIEIG